MGTITAELNSLHAKQKVSADVIDIRAKIQNCIWTVEETLALLQSFKTAAGLEETGKACIVLADVLAKALVDIAKKPELIELKEWAGE